LSEAVDIEDQLTAGGPVAGAEGVEQEGNLGMRLPGNQPQTGQISRESRKTNMFPDILTAAVPLARGGGALLRSQRNAPASRRMAKKQLGVKKKRNLCGLNPIFWRFAAEVGVNGELPAMTMVTSARIAFAAAWLDGSLVAENEVMREATQVDCPELGYASGTAELTPIPILDCLSHPNLVDVTFSSSNTVRPRSAGPHLVPKATMLTFAAFSFGRVGPTLGRAVDHRPRRVLGPTAPVPHG